MDAAEEFIEADGAQSLPMSSLAERAGVSVGSLYQYFPSKEAVVAAVGRRLNEHLVAELSSELRGDRPLEKRVQAMVQRYCLHGSPRLRRALLQVVSREWEYVGLFEAEGELLSILEGLMREYWHFRTETEVRDHTRMLFFATRGAVEGTLVHDVDAMPRIATLLSEMVVQTIRAPVLRHDASSPEA